MSEPDQLYTLRNQVWLGHYALALDEGKNLLRSKSSLSAALRTERDEFVARSLLALGRYSEVGAGVNASGIVDVGVKLLQLQASLQSGSTPAQPVCSRTTTMVPSVSFRWALTWNTCTSPHKSIYAWTASI